MVILYFRLFTLLISAAIRTISHYSKFNVSSLLRCPIPIHASPISFREKVVIGLTVQGSDCNLHQSPSFHLHVKHSSSGVLHHSAFSLRPLSRLSCFHVSQRERRIRSVISDLCFPNNSTHLMPIYTLSILHG